MATTTGVRSFDASLETTREWLMRQHDPEEACRAVFSVIERQMPGGEVEDVKRILPESIRDLWP